jgi:outer membrane protein TolC
MMRKVFIALFIFTASTHALAGTLSLDSCRAMALRNNKQLNASKLKQELARNVRKAVRTKYLPKVDALGGYEYFSREISILSDAQKSNLANLGTNIVSGAGGSLPQLLGALAQQGAISPTIANDLGTIFSQTGANIAQSGNAIGQQINNAFRTDTRNIWAGAVMVRQPLFMGGAITAANNIADINEAMAANSLDLAQQNTLYNIDRTYWTVVSLKHKQKLANSYRNLVKKLSDDVHKMIAQGVTTRAEGLKVDVKVNEADMQVTEVDNGLSLARMLLCQLCGMPLDSKFTLADEDSDISSIETIEEPIASDSAEACQRAEVKMLNYAVKLSEQTTKLMRSQYMPHLFLTGGYMISNPNVLSGFNKEFKGLWNVGVTLHVPVWNWFEGAYKVRAGKAATAMAQMEMNDAREKIELQIEQTRYKLSEAHKRLATAIQNLTSANENLRCANIGFREGVIETTEVMAAQTAWQKAQTQKIDAEIEVKLAQVGLKKALGRLK